MSNPMSDRLFLQKIEVYYGRECDRSILEVAHSNQFFLFWTIQLQFFLGSFAEFIVGSNWVDR